MSFDEVFRDLDRAVVMKQEIKCFKQQRNGKIRWTIEIDDPKAAKGFESRMSAFLNRIGRGRNVPDSPEEEI